MKQLIFTLILLPFLAAYPAGNSADANANASAADVKTTDADVKSALSTIRSSSDSTPTLPDPADIKAAREGKDNSAVQAGLSAATADWQGDIDPQLELLERQLFPGPHALFSRIRALEKTIIGKVHSFAESIDPRPIKAKYSEVIAVFGCPRPIWDIVSDYARKNPRVTGETLRQLFLGVDVESISNLHGVSSNYELTPISPLTPVLDRFNKEHEYYSQRSPYSTQEVTKYWEQRELAYKPYGIQLTKFENREGEVIEILPWMRQRSRDSGANQFDEDLFIEVLNRLTNPSKIDITEETEEIARALNLNLAEHTNQIDALEKERRSLPHGLSVLSFDDWRRTLQEKGALNKMAESGFGLLDREKEHLFSLLDREKALRQTTEAQLLEQINPQHKDTRAWKYFITLANRAYSWKKIMKWVATLPPNDQEKLSITKRKNLERMRITEAPPTKSSCAIQ